MFGSYLPSDVTVLLKDITGKVTPQNTAEREQLIQSGVHYSSMLPIEYEPSPEYLAAYHHAVKRHAAKTAQATVDLAEEILAAHGDQVVLVSLARAGTPIGILVKRYLEERYKISIPHYTISIIRDIGIDHNALDYILARHNPDSLEFIDGWTGKGVIQNELKRALEARGLTPSLGVLSDPARVATHTGTYQDFLIPSACLNATVSGLLSRTFYRPDIIGPKDFHGAMFYANLQSSDLTYHFIDAVACYFKSTTPTPKTLQAAPLLSPQEEIAQLQATFNIQNRNFLKPSIGEATRVLLRRLPWKILVANSRDFENLDHIYTLAHEKQVEVLEYPLKNYLACGLIRTV